MFSSKNHDIRMKLTNKTKRNFKKKMRKKEEELERGEIGLQDYCKLETVIEVI